MLWKNSTPDGATNNNDIDLSAVAFWGGTVGLVWSKHLKR